MTILILSMISCAIGLAMLVASLWGYFDGKPLTWKQVGLSGFFIFFAIGCIIHHNITQYGQQQVRLSNLKKVVSTKNDVKFYTSADNTIRTVEAVSNDTSLVYSGNKVFKINAIRIID